MRRRAFLDDPWETKEGNLSVKHKHENAQQTVFYHRRPGAATKRPCPWGPPVGRVCVFSPMACPQAFQRRGMPSPRKAGLAPLFLAATPSNKVGCLFRAKQKPLSASGFCGSRLSPERPLSNQ